MGKSIHQETQEILGIIVLLQCEDRANAIFCILKNKLPETLTWKQDLSSPLHIPQILIILCDTTISCHWRGN